nr:MAG TPA: hypothetical protein [Caudoviricetes sp.]DAU53686.1 MAG TPA: hypothetical protein [Caudoviricetes sp.]
MLNAYIIYKIKDRPSRASLLLKPLLMSKAKVLH